MIEKIKRLEDDGRIYDLIEYGGGHEYKIVNKFTTPTEIPVGLSLSPIYVLFKHEGDIRFIKIDGDKYKEDSDLNDSARYILQDRGHDWNKLLEDDKIVYVQIINYLENPAIYIPYITKDGDVFRVGDIESDYNDVIISTELHLAPKFESYEDILLSTSGLSLNLIEPTYCRLYKSLVEDSYNISSLCRAIVYLTGDDSHKVKFEKIKQSRERLFLDLMNIFNESKNNNVHELVSKKGLTAFTSLVNVDLSSTLKTINMFLSQNDYLVEFMVNFYNGE